MPEKLRPMEACGSDLDLTYQNTDTLPLGCVSVVSNSRVLEADLLCPVGYRVGPPWIKLAPACPIELGSEKIWRPTSPLQLFIAVHVTMVLTVFFFPHSRKHYPAVHILPIRGTLSDGGMLSATISWNTVRARRTVTPRDTFSPESAGR